MHLLIALLQWLGRMLLGEFREAWAYWKGVAANWCSAPAARAVPGPDGSRTGWMTIHPSLTRLGFWPGPHVQPAVVPCYRSPARAERVRQIPGADNRFRSAARATGADPPEPAGPLWA